DPPAGRSPGVRAGANAQRSADPVRPALLPPDLCRRGEARASRRHPPRLRGGGNLRRSDRRRLSDQLLRVAFAQRAPGLVGSYMAHLISLVTEGVFQKFPPLKFVLVEGGVSWLPPLMWRFDKNWRAQRQTTPWLDRPPSEVVTEHILL